MLIDQYVHFLLKLAFLVSLFMLYIVKKKCAFTGSGCSCRDARTEDARAGGGQELRRALQGLARTSLTRK